MVQTHDELLTVKEAAAILKVTPHTIYRWVSEGKLPAIRHSRRVVRLRRGDVDARRGTSKSASGTMGALRRHFGAIDKETAEELRRIIRETREADRAFERRRYLESIRDDG
jgi:excisionase family DNA binding protein